MLYSINIRDVQAEHAALLRQLVIAQCPDNQLGHVIAGHDLVGIEFAGRITVDEVHVHRILHIGEQCAGGLDVAEGSRAGRIIGHGQITAACGQHQHLDQLAAGSRLIRVHLAVLHINGIVLHHQGQGALRPVPGNILGCCLVGAESLTVAVVSPFA
ncbi:hypothetical protein D3C76_1306210 [compost metagenome]